MNAALHKVHISSHMIVVALPGLVGGMLNVGSDRSCFESAFCFVKAPNDAPTRSKALSLFAQRQTQTVRIQATRSSHPQEHLFHVGKAARRRSPLGLAITASLCYERASGPVAQPDRAAVS